MPGKPPTIQARDFARLAAPLFGIEQNHILTLIRYMREGGLLPRGKSGPGGGTQLSLKDGVTVLLGLLVMPPASWAAEIVGTILTLPHESFTRRETSSEAGWIGGDSRSMTLKEWRTSDPERFMDWERVPFDKLHGLFGPDLVEFIDCWLLTSCLEFVPEIDLIRHGGGLQARLHFSGLTQDEATGEQAASVGTLCYGDTIPEGFGLIRQTSLSDAGLMKLFAGFQTE